MRDYLEKPIVAKSPRQVSCPLWALSINFNVALRTPEKLDGMAEVVDLSVFTR